MSSISMDVRDTTERWHAPLKRATMYSAYATGAYIGVVALTILSGKALELLSGGYLTFLSSAILSSKWIFPIAIGVGVSGIGITAICLTALAINASIYLIFRN